MQSTLEIQGDIGVKLMDYLAEENLQILMVEPSKTQAKIIRGYLEQLGIKSIYPVKSAEEALEFLENEVVDLIISALYLPKMPGDELLIQIKQDERLSETCFLLISSETKIKALDPIRQAGATAILPKPFQLNDLQTALHHTLDSLNLEELECEVVDVETLEVLCVDDSKLALKCIINTLNKLGITHITPASDGSEAIDILQDKFFDLVVTDYNMPDVDGEALTQYIRTVSNQQSVPILMITSEQNESRLAAVQQSGVSAICDKPFDIAVIQSMLCSNMMVS